MKARLLSIGNQFRTFLIYRDPQKNPWLTIQKGPQGWVIQFFKRQWLSPGVQRWAEKTAPKKECAAVLWHGPGHQSNTHCRRTDEHDVHEAVYGRQQLFAEWRGDEAMTGFFDEAPELDD